jgi:predicted nucleotidyltransferase
MMDSDKRFYIRELSKNLSIPYGMLYREVKNLVLLGILQEEKTGKVTLISANRKLPYFAELKSMMIKTAGLGDLVKNVLSGLDGIRYALIYGSFASGAEAEGSDIDLLVVGDISEEEVLKAVSRVEKDVGREVNYIVWSEREFSKRVRGKHHLLAEIIRKPVMMLVGDEDGFRRAVKR